MDSNRNEDHASNERKGHYARTLTESEASKLAMDMNLLSEFKRTKLEAEAQKNWDLFYKRNETELAAASAASSNRADGPPVLLEVGCGVGNFIFPLLEENTCFFVYACDFSPRAVDFVKSHPLYDEARVKAFRCDLTRDALTDNVPECSVDVVTMIFVLSAICPEKMSAALENVRRVLKPGGVVLLARTFTVRQDGTRAYYFSEENLARLFRDAGFEAESNGYVRRETVNKKEGICVPRVFVQGRFRKLCGDGPDRTLTGNKLRRRGRSVMLSDVTILVVDYRNSGKEGKQARGLLSIVAQILAVEASVNCPAGKQPAPLTCHPQGRGGQLHDTSTTLPGKN
ncbi:hypothetical protein HPB47_017647 [Ixodes persulcatus]|uniref:Uncharacterized protein n=1 Tax=Ixodes persulcatus TaxID=34615 RepID=A0AC60QNN6_IXOPE|nr:hypothetical protein HPB47_017647 [Ixodes persulcatus]